jgi:hypothetical protein
MSVYSFILIIPKINYRYETSNPVLGTLGLHLRNLCVHGLLYLIPHTHMLVIHLASLEISRNHFVRIFVFVSVCVCVCVWVCVCIYIFIFHV